MLLLSSICFFTLSVTSHPTIGFWSTWEIKCGIAMYTKHIVNALKAQGYKVTVYPHNLPPAEIIKRIKNDKISVLNIEYESSIMPPLPKLIETIKMIKSNKVKVILTVHTETPAIKELHSYVDRFIYHKPANYYPSSSKVAIIRMGVPVFNTPDNKNNIKRKYGFQDKDIIISTIGFLASTKEYPEMLRRLVQWLQLSPHHKVQLLASHNNSSSMASKVSLAEHHKINAVIKHHNIAHQVIHIPQFISQQEISERLWMSDIGFLWMAKDTRGSSAACKEFITARLPVVITDSTHYHDQKKGVIKVTRDKDHFINILLSSLKSPILKILKNDLQMLYNKLNYNNLIHEYIKVLVE